MGVLREALEVSPGAVVATDTVSVDADCNSGAVLDGTPRCRLACEARETREEAEVAPAPDARHSARRNFMHADSSLCSVLDLGDASKPRFSPFRAGQCRKLDANFAVLPRCTRMNVRFVLYDFGFLHDRGKLV